jgi:hypothetical protein
MDEGVDGEESTRKRAYVDDDAFIRISRRKSDLSTNGRKCEDGNTEKIKEEGNGLRCKNQEVQGNKATDK